MRTLFFEEKKNHFDKITAFLDFEILQFLAETLWKVCIQCLRLQSEPVQRCFRHIEILHSLWYKGKNIYIYFFFFYKIMAFSNLGIIQVLTSTWWQGCIINFFNSFLATDLKLCIAITDELKMCTCYFEEKWGTDRRRGGQAQLGGIVCVLQTHLCHTDTIS